MFRPWLPLLSSPIPHHSDFLLLNPGLNQPDLGARRVVSFGKNLNRLVHPEEGDYC
jgi:hypothetical protein